MIDLDAPWEPRTFAVGDRVRVRLSPECRFPTRRPTAGTIVEHYPEQDGLEGEIRATTYSPYPDHPYLVSLPETCRGYCCCMSGYFAALELEPIDADAEADHA